MGPMFYQRLKHMVRDKMHTSRGKVVGLTRQLNRVGSWRWFKVGRNGARSELRTVPNVLRERMMISSTRMRHLCACGVIFARVKRPRPSLSPATKLLCQELMSMGVQVKIQTRV